MACLCLFTQRSHDLAFSGDWIIKQKMHYTYLRSHKTRWLLPVARVKPGLCSEAVAHTAGWRWVRHTSGLGTPPPTPAPLSGFSLL